MRIIAGMGQVNWAGPDLKAARQDYASATASNHLLRRQIPIWIASYCLGNSFANTVSQSWAPTCLISGPSKRDFPLAMLVEAERPRFGWIMLDKREIIFANSRLLRANLGPNSNTRTHWNTFEIWRKLMMFSLAVIKAAAEREREILHQQEK